VLQRRYALSVNSVPGLSAGEKKKSKLPKLANEADVVPSHHHDSF